MATHTDAVLTSPPPIKLSLEELREDVISGLVDQGFERNDSVAAANGSIGDTFDEMFRSALKQLRSWGAQPARGKTVASKGKTVAPAKAAATVKTCPGWGGKPCVKELSPKNTSGFCNKCYQQQAYAKSEGNAVRLCDQDCGRRLRRDNQNTTCIPCQSSKRTDALKAATKAARQPAPSQPQPQPPQEAPMHRSPQEMPKPQPQPVPSASNRDGRFDVRLSEPQINRFLDGMELDWKEFVRMLPVDLKLQLVNHYFFNNLDEPRDEPRAPQAEAPETETAAAAAA